MRCTAEQIEAYGNQGAYCAEAGQHPRLNGEHALSRVRGVSIELSVQGIPYE